MSTKFQQKDHLFGYILIALLGARIVFDIFSLTPLWETKRFGDININALWAGTMLLFALVYFSSHVHSLNAFKTPVTKTFLAFLLWLGISAVISFESNAALAELIRILDILLVFILAGSLLNTAKKRRMLVLGLLVVSFIPILVGIAQIFGGISFQDPEFEVIEDVSRIFGTFLHPNAFALYLLFMLFLGFWAWDNKLLNTKLERQLLTLLMLAYGGLLLFTFSRSVLAGLIIFLTIIIARKHPPLILPFALMILVGILSPTFFGQRAREVISFSDPASSLVWRYLLWQDTIGFFVQKPFTGHGLETFSALTEQVRPKELGVTSAHNDYLRLAIETGLIGLGLYVLLWMMLLKQLYPNHKSAFSLGIVLLLISFFDNVFQFSVLQYLWWGFTGMLLVKEKN